MGFQPVMRADRLKAHLHMFWLRQNMLNQQALTRRATKAPRQPAPPLIPGSV